MSSTSTNHFSRRSFLKGAAAAGAGLAGLRLASETEGLLFASAKGGTGRGGKVLVLGIDGMDPNLLQRYVGEGIMPNFAKLIAEGDFKPLQTTSPPQSPVAWSTFITGMNPGGHGIFDFIHRDCHSLQPRSAMSESHAVTRRLNLGSYSLPLGWGSVEQLRRGKAFWQVLDVHGVPSIVYKMPANYPPAPTRAKSLSGMGTPDLVGTLGGQFSFYTTNRKAFEDDAEESAQGADGEDGLKTISVSGGKIHQVAVRDWRVDATLYGPANTFRRERHKVTQPHLIRQGTKYYYTNPDCTIDFSAFLDPKHPVAKFVVQDKEFILREGEWSDWVRLDFPALPYVASVNGIARFYLKQVRPDFKLYVTPLQINPAEPVATISTPKDWSAELRRDLGPFYTQGLPDDTSAFSAGVFSGEEYLEQSTFVLRERGAALTHLLKTFKTYKKGMLFFYISNIDQGCHMLWRYFDKDHPGYVKHDTLKDGIRTLYRKMDEMLAEVRDALEPEDDLVVMSDHGFAPFYRAVNLNSWLLEQGYMKLRDPSWRGEFNYSLENVHWEKTQAYAIGINGLYVNLKQRETKTGSVAPGLEYEVLLDRLTADLLALRDPKNGEQVVSRVTRPRVDFSGPHADRGPDLIVGYNSGYRVSWETPLGLKFPREVFVDNMDAWSGDHCMDPDQVPGVLLSNRKITLSTPALHDLTVGVLGLCGVEKLPEMIGTDCFG